jgi:pimeloyl-ACP methyl ester carboxylesterase
MISSLLFLHMLSCHAHLDFMFFNPVHCSSVPENGCVNEGDYWDEVCISCEEEYDWSEEFDWMDGTLSDDFHPIQPIQQDLVEHVSIETSDKKGTLDIHFVPAPQEPIYDSFTDILLVYSHGNYASVEHYVPRIQMLNTLGFPILIWDYRGFGKSLPDTIPSAEEFLADSNLIFEQALQYLHAEADSPTQILSYGFSLGGIPATEMAVNNQKLDGFCALILEAGFTSVNQMLESATSLDMPGGFLTTGNFENDKKLQGFSKSFFYMVGDKDHYFPPDVSQRMTEGISGYSEFWILEDVYHGISNKGIPEDSYKNYAEHLHQFLLNGDCISE